MRGSCTSGPMPARGSRRMLTNRPVTASRVASRPGLHTPLNRSGNAPCALTARTANSTSSPSTLACPANASSPNPRCTVTAAERPPRAGEVSTRNRVEYRPVASCLLATTAATAFRSRAWSRPPRRDPRSQQQPVAAIAAQKVGIALGKVDAERLARQRAQAELGFGRVGPADAERPRPGRGTARNSFELGGGTTRPGKPKRWAMSVAAKSACVRASPLPVGGRGRSPPARFGADPPERAEDAGQDAFVPHRQRPLEHVRRLAGRAARASWQRRRGSWRPRSRSGEPLEVAVHVRVVRLREERHCCEAREAFFLPEHDPAELLELGTRGTFPRRAPTRGVISNGVLILTALDPLPG